MALQMFLRDPSTNPVLTSANGYAGGISKTDMLENIANTDNNAVITPGMQDKLEEVVVVDTFLV